MHNYLDRTGRHIDVGDLLRYYRSDSSCNDNENLLAIYAGEGVIRVRLPNGLPETLLPDEVVIVVEGNA